LCEALISAMDCYAQDTSALQFRRALNIKVHSSRCGAHRLLIVVSVITGGRSCAEQFHLKRFPREEAFVLVSEGKERRPPALIWNKEIWLQDLSLILSSRGTYFEARKIWSTPQPCPSHFRLAEVPDQARQVFLAPGPSFVVALSLGKIG
jgi:hypothetical protein